MLLTHIPCNAPTQFQQSLENPVPPSCVMSQTLRTGCQYMAERLATAYHFILHGFYGLRSKQMYEWAGMDDWAKLQPHGASVPRPDKAFDGWTIKMTLSLHESTKQQQQTPPNVVKWDLHNMVDQKLRSDMLFTCPSVSGGGNVMLTDPLAAMQWAAAPLIFRFRAEVLGFSEWPSIDSGCFYSYRCLVPWLLVVVVFELYTHTHTHTHIWIC